MKDEGYDIEVLGAHLVVRRVPYVNGAKTIQYGVLVTPLTMASPQTAGVPADHTLHFQGEIPCHRNGIPIDIINNSNPAVIAGISVNHYFSCKCNGRNYVDYHEKIETYCLVLSSPAMAIDPSVTPKPNKHE